MQVVPTLLSNTPKILRVLLKFFNENRRKTAPEHRHTRETYVVDSQDGGRGASGVLRVEIGRKTQQ
jgi:hypothetical protein